mgnify:CR=1 FL=1
MSAVNCAWASRKGRTSERWLRDLMLRLGPDAQVLSPPEWAQIGADAAAALLAMLMVKPNGLFGESIRKRV